MLLLRLSPEATPKLIPEEGSAYYLRVQHYQELLDSLQMDAYTHGCILHPEITVDSHIPAYAATCIRSKTCVVIHPCFEKVSWRKFVVELFLNVLVIGALFSHALYFLVRLLFVPNTLLCFCVTAQIGNTQTELKKLAEQNPELKDAYVAKQRRLKVSKDVSMPNVIYTEDWGLNPPKATLP